MDSDEWVEKFTPLLAEAESEDSSEGSPHKRVIDFLEDDSREMTNGRRLALSLMDHNWYNPRAGRTQVEEIKTLDSALSQMEVEGGLKKVDDFDAMMSNSQPNLALAWAYFEHVSLYRYLVPKDEAKQNKRCCHKLRDRKLDKAEPGENDDPTRLYHPIFTPHSQLGDFGLGIGLYFTSLRAITLITFMAGLVSLYNIMYFASDAYQPSQDSKTISLLQRGSAICSYTSWVPCTDCICTKDSQDVYVDSFPADRCATDVNHPDLTFVLRNNCDGTPWELTATNYASLIAVIISVILLSYYISYQQIKFDEDEQTAQDYSVKISNPPEDAVDPDEWFHFFHDNCDGAHATVITIARDNDLLVRTLVKRRELLRTIKNMQEGESSMKMLDLARVAAEEERSRNFWSRVKALIFPGIPELFARVVALNAKVEGLAQLNFPVTNIFITFETEKDQRRVLSSLSVGSICASRNELNAVSDPKYLFRGKYVLDVEEPDEPNTIRWQDLNASHWQKLKERGLTFLCTIVAVVLVAVIVKVANQESTIGAAFTIALFNTLFPLFAKFLTYLERHPSESSKQASLHFKICFFRWINTAVVISIITPFTHTLVDGTGLITQVYALFFADIVTSNALQLTDIYGHIQRHYLAPRAATQDAMNILFEGTEYELAERYTDMTKTLFLCLWYSSIFPGSYFICSVSLMIKYYVDKFSLMRTWKRAPQLGNSIATFSSHIFFPLAIVAQAVLSSYYWSGFPFDQVCINDGINEAYVNTFTLTPNNGGSSVSVTYTQDDMDYHFCNQNMMTLKGGFTFPFVPTVSTNMTNPKEWMTDEQIIYTSYYGWSAVGITCVVLMIFMWRIARHVLNLFRSTYEEVGEDQDIPFSSVTSRSAYIPAVKSSLFAYPLIACNTDDIDEELYDFTDPFRTFRFYDLTKDAKKLCSAALADDSEPPGFSLVKHYPPKEVKKLNESSR